MTGEDYSRAKECFLYAMAQKRVFPHPATNLGWCYYVQGKISESLRYYEYSSGIYLELLQMADEFRAMPDVISGIRREAANVWLHIGVVNEKLMRDEESLKAYNRALELNDEFSLAYYNKAVVYWKRGDLVRARENLELTLRYDPANETARSYLMRLK